MKMKLLNQIKVKSKESLLVKVKVKETKTMPFFKVFQKMVQFNKVYTIIYSMILFVECIQLFNQMTIHYDDDFVQEETIKTVHSTSYYLFNIIHYIDSTHYVTPLHLSFESFVILYSITVSLIVLNFIALIIIDYLENHWTIKSHQLKTVHIIFGLFNYINLKVLIFPVNVILLESFFINSYISKDDNNTMNLFNRLNSDVFNAIPLYSYIFLSLLNVLAFFINLFMMINTGLFFNDFNIIRPRVCWGQSYPQLEMTKLLQKFLLTFFNSMPNHMLFSKHVIIVLINICYCTYRYLEWYYTSWIYKSIIISIDYSLLFYSIVILVYRDIQQYGEQIIFLLIISGIIGLLSSCIIMNSQRSKLGTKPSVFLNEYKNEYSIASVIIQLIHLIQNLSNDNKSINDPLLFGFYKEHIKYCHNPNCISHLFSDLVYNSSGMFMNQIESFELKKSDFNLYCKANSNDAFEILPDHSKVQCEKALYSLISCIITSSLPKLKHTSIAFIPIIEVYIYLHIFNNPLYALFQVMKYYQYNLSYREKFIFYQTLNEVLEKIKEVNKNTNKSTTQTDLVSVANYYYYSDQFLNSTFEMIASSKVLFYKLIKMKPTPNEVLKLSYALGKHIKKMHQSYIHITDINSSDIAIVRLYSFILGRIFLMKMTAHENHVRLLQSIKLVILNDKIKNSSGVSQNNSNQNKVTLKSFQENSESALIIVSGILENLGDILYCNHLITSVSGYEKKELIGASLNKLLPHPIADWHNEMILSLYKTGNMDRINHFNNRLLVHKNKILVNVDLFIRNLPNIQYGLMYICIMRNSLIFTLEIENQANKHTEVVERKDDDFLLKKPVCQDHLDPKLFRTDTTGDNNINKLPKMTSKKLLFELNFQKQLVKTMYYKLNETGLLLLSEKLDILHMNFYTMHSLFDLNKPFKQGKVNITKICKDFIRKQRELENGEIVHLSFDLSPFTNQAKQQKSIDELISINKSFHNKRLKSQKINIIKPKSYKVSLAKKNTLDCKYYCLIIQKGTTDNSDSFSSSNFNSNSDSDSGSINQESDDDIINNSQTAYSRLGSLYHGMLDIEKTKEYKIEKEKNTFLRGTSIPQFTTIANIVIYFLLVIIVIWVIISNVFEFNLINKIQNDLFILNKNQLLITTISHYIIDSLLVIRANFFPLTNTAYLYPLLKETMLDEKINIYTIVSTISNFFSSNKASSFNKIVFSTALPFKTITENNIEEIQEINLSFALKKFIFSLDYLLIKDNYKNMTIEQYFDSNYQNSIKCKIHFLYYNFFDGFQSHLISLSGSVQDSLINDLKKEKRNLMIIFIFSILFGILISIVLIFISINKEKLKGRYLVSLSNVYDIFYENKIELLEKFEYNLHLVIQEDQCIHHIKQSLEKDHRFRTEFIEGEDYYSSKLNNVTEMLTPRSNLNSVSRTKMRDRERNLEVLFKRQKTTTSKLNGRYFQGFDNGLINFGLKIHHTDKAINFNRNNTNNVPDYGGRTSQGEIGKARSIVSLSSKPRKIETKSTSNGMKINDANYVIKSLDPSENPNLNQRTFISIKSAKALVNEDNVPNEIEEDKEDMNLKEKEEEDYVEEKIKTYTNYKLSLHNNCLEILLSIILINSFFVISIIYLNTYIQTITQIISTSGIIYSRTINLNNFIIAVNFVYLYFNEQVLGNFDNLSSIELKGNNIEELYRQILKNIDKTSIFYLTVSYYESNESCLTFRGFHSEYSLITCEEFIQDHGLTFEISRIYLILHQLYTNYNIKKDTKVTPEEKASLFNNPVLIDILIQNNFFLRLFETDISLTHVEMYQNVLKTIRLVCDIKFWFYLVLLAIIVVVYKFYLISRLIENINNLNRVMIFFDEENYKK